MQKYGHILIKIIIGVFVCVGSISIGGLWRLNHGPVSLNYLVKPWINQYCSEDILKIEKIELIWQGWKNPFVVQFHQVVFEKPQEISITVPLVELTFKFSGLYKKKFLPTFINCVQPLCVLKKDADIPEMTKNLFSEGGGENPFRKLKQFQITGAVLKNETMTLENGNFFGIQENKKIKGIIQFKLIKDDYHLPLPLKIDFLYTREQNKLSADVLWNEHDIHPWLHCFTDIEIKAPFKGKLTAQWDFNASLLPLSIQGEAEGLKGEIKAPFFKKPFPLQSFHTKIAIEKKQIFLKDLKVQSDDAVVTGEVNVDIPEISMLPQTAKDLQARQFSFNLQASEISWGLIVDGWPIHTFEQARTWIADHLSKGTLETISVQGEGQILAHCPLEIEWRLLKGQAAFRETELLYKSKAPPLEQMKGQLIFDKEKLEVQLHSGQWHSLMVKEGHFFIKSFSQPLIEAALDLKFQGSLPKFLSLLDASGISLLNRTPLKKDQTTGDIQGQFALTFPLKNNLVSSDFKPKLDATIKNADTILTINPNALLTVKNANFTCGFSPGLLEIKGGGIIQNAVSTYKVSYIMDKAVNINVEGKILINDLSVLCPVIRDYGEGPIDYHVHYKKDLNKKNVPDFFEGDIDCKQAKVILTPLNWQKEINIPFVIHFNITPVLDDINFIVDAAGTDAQIKGSGRWNTKTSMIHHIDFPIVHLGDNHFSCSFIPPLLTIKGKEVDVSQIFHQHQDTSFDDVDFFKALVDIDTLIVHPKQLLRKLRAKLEWKAGNLNYLLLKGQILEKKKLFPVEVHLHTTPKDRIFSLDTSNGGALFDLLEISHTIKSGHLRITGEQIWDPKAMLQKHPFKGNLRLNNFNIINAGFFTHLFSLTMIVGVFDLVRGQGIAFNEARIRFTALNDIITLEKAHASGVSLGITAQGTIDRKNHKIALEGTLIPAYLINTVLSNIPLVGQLLSGGNKGIFATSFHVKGDMKNPKIQANPLSTLAPGFIKEIFSQKDENHSSSA